MTTCTHTANCGPLGEVELTVSYKFRPVYNGRGIEPTESASATIYWIKIGGSDGVEVDLSDDYITDEIIPACAADWNGAEEVAAESHAEMMRERRAA